MSKERMEKIASLRKRLPYAGMNKTGGNKTTGCCPHCGSGPSVYRHHGRFKRCLYCGYDRQLEKLFDIHRYAAKRGQLVSGIGLDIALEYYERVYG